MAELYFQSHLVAFSRISLLFPSPEPSSLAFSQGEKGSEPSLGTTESRCYTQAGSLRVWYGRQECAGVANF